jgi:hydroxypyruvate reductase
MTWHRTLKEDLLACVERALEAARPGPRVTEVVARELAEAPSVHVVAVGKAAVGMADGAAVALGERLASGLVVTTAPGPPQAPGGFRLRTAGHPVPDESSVAAAHEVVDQLDRLGAEDALLFLLSGGGSALLTWPAGRLVLDDLRSTTEILLAAGASIDDLNTVRKHLDRVKGGQLARRGAPGRILELVLSDVVGDRLDVIASGPLTADPSTYADALEVVERWGVWRELPSRVREHLRRGRDGELDETPKPGDPCFASVDSRLVGGSRPAVEAAAAEAERRGYETLVLTTQLTGEARAAGGVLAAIAREVVASGAPVTPPACVVAGGETTVTVRGDGSGGRNQELALGAVEGLAGLPAILGSIGTDGVDGPTDAAGALAFGDTLERAQDLGVDPRKALERNDSHGFFEALGDLVVTGPTGTNVMDLQILLVADPAKVVSSEAPGAALSTAAEGWATAVPGAPSSPAAAVSASAPDVGQVADAAEARVGELVDRPGHLEEALVQGESSGAPREGGSDVESPLAAFAALGLGEVGLRAVARAGFTRPWPIQEKVIPVALTDRDVVGLAETGSGKTAAFCLPLLERLARSEGTRAVMLSPTREIALQTQRFLEGVAGEAGLSSVALVGGLAIGPQIQALRRKPCFVVATPGRLLDHLDRRTLDPSRVEELVLDEADHMLDLGFLPQINSILERLPERRRTTMFSATMPAAIERLARRFMRDPLLVDLRPVGGAAAGIRHELYLVAEEDKKACLLAILAGDTGSTLVFMRRKVDADWASRQLELEGHPVDRIHSDRSQSQRLRALEGFREGEHRILVATDVAARGLDIPRIERIVNFDMPETVEDYIHRAGRTARGDREGTVSTIATWREKAMVREIEGALGLTLPRREADGVEAYVESPERKRSRRRRLL